MRGGRAKCGAGDVQAWVTGNYADLVDLRYKGTLIYRDAIHDGNGLKCDADIRIMDKYILVRFGKYRDMVRLYAIVERLGDSPKFHFASFEWRDYGIWRMDTSPDTILLQGGRQRDLWKRVCWDGSSWKVTPGRYNSAPSESECTLPLPDNRVIP